jgi:urocanate hydratase
MGGAQPLAAVMAGLCMVAVDVDQTRIAMRLRTGYLDEQADSLADALARVTAACKEVRTRERERVCVCVCVCVCACVCVKLIRSSCHPPFFFHACTPFSFDSQYRCSYCCLFLLTYPLFRSFSTL